ncbi:DUF7006 family protein [Vagococcus xieshaowenii]|uniref:Uncharacterized protein n=1 Tax=Vagococcus xieshaowenii TaxID=2562451 RepID=A0AAJ5EDL0_9ENTE|nr:hypothetical protein [Vagococcus xieshaowenii]QCA27930.1 hypothetical protein E4Z98_00630 [Vagococcus xieshaowenii]TFZ40315.1 hypothetical protein E4031_07695 [Vagococcus xieshaowenii]
MKTNKENLLQKDYFNYYKLVCNKYSHRQKIVYEIEENISKMKDYLSEITPQNSFQIFSCLLRIDEELQLLVAFIDEKELTEEEIITMSKRDSKRYFLDCLSEQYSKENMSLHMLS